MGVLHDVIADGGVVFAGAIGEAELEQLFEAASERCLTEAEARTIYLSDAIEALDRYRDFEPDHEEVRGHLGHHEACGDWRRVVGVAAYCAVREYLGAQVSKDHEALRTALDEATERGYSAVALHATCPWGWAPHEREIDWTTGTLFQWRRLDGDVNVTALSVPVSGGDIIWMKLDRR